MPVDARTRDAEGLGDFGRAFAFGSPGERAAAAREAARLRGRHTGRPPRLSIDQMRQVRALRGSGESISDLVRRFGVSRATIYRALQSAESITRVARV